MQNNSNNGTIKKKSCTAFECGFRTQMSVLWMSFKMILYSPNTHICIQTFGADSLPQNEFHQSSDLKLPLLPLVLLLSPPHSFLVFNPQLSGRLTFLNLCTTQSSFYRCGDANASGTLLPLTVCCFNDIKVNGAWYIANATLTYKPKKKNIFSTWGCVWVPCSCEVQENVVRLWSYVCAI